MIIFFTFLLLLFSQAQPITSSITHQSEQSEDTAEVEYIPNIRQKCLERAYEQLCDAIEQNNVKRVEVIYAAHPGLAEFSCQPIGSPLHFVKSFAMAKFLVSKMHISPNFCDQWGEVPSQSIALSNKERFSSKDEQVKIILYFKQREIFLKKIYYQIKNNKNFHMRISILAMSGILITQIAALIKYLQKQ